MTTDLKPCPFCGSTDLRNRGTYVRCANCNTEGPYKRDSDHEEYSAGRWNSRVAPAPDAAGLVAAMEEITRVDPKWDAYTASRIIAVQTLRAYRAAAQPDAGSKDVMELLGDALDTVEHGKKHLADGSAATESRALRAIETVIQAVAELARERHT